MSHADSENPSEIFVGKKLLELLSNKPLRNLLKIPAKIFNRFFQQILVPDDQSCPSDSKNPRKF